jgi:exonuclease SbcC
VPLLDQRNSTQSRLEEARRAHARFQAESTREGESRLLLETQLLAAQDKADTLPRLEARLHALDEVKGILETRPRLAGRLQEARLALLRASSGVDVAARALAAAREGAEKAGKALASALVVVPSVDEEMAKAALQRLEECRRALARTEEAGRRADQRLEEAERALENSEIQRKNAVDSWNSAQGRLAPLETAHLAHRLARELKDGDPCPVCGQGVDGKRRRPATAPAGLQDAEAAAAAAGKSREMAENAWQRADATCAQARQVRLDALAASQQAAGALRDALEGLERVAGPGTPDEVAARVAAQERAARERHQAEITHGQAALELGKAELEAHRVQAAVDGGNAEVTRIQRELAETDERIGRVSTHPDPAQERSQLAQDIQAVRETLRLRQQEMAAASARHAAVEARLAEAAQRVEHAGVDAAAASAVVGNAWPGAGFPSENEARAAVLPLPELERLEARSREQQGARQRLVELERQLGGSPVDEGEVTSSQRKLEEARARHQQLLQQRAVIHSRLLDLETRVQQAQALLQQRNAVGAQFALHETLALDLRNDRFQAFLLQEAFAQLVAGASVRLMELTGRYTFELRDDEFFVLDHDNARDRRSADTLSGGETFLASLALALELSDQVQRAAGATALDSLFIDEGFATLDGETLEVAASAVECLPVGGRMVGIITHLPALTQRMPARLMVEKRVEGSRIHVERS